MSFRLFSIFSILYMVVCEHYTHKSTFVHLYMFFLEHFPTCKIMRSGQRVHRFHVLVGAAKLPAKKLQQFLHSLSLYACLPFSTLLLILFIILFNLCQYKDEQF